jgi:uncharacterized protein (DUF1800 family)
MNRRIVGCSALLLVIVAAGAYAKKQKPSKAADEQKRSLHAIDRLTFGPRPGDVQAVMAMGVDNWIDLELHPDRIDDGAMQARLAEYRTLAMSSRDMVLAFPSRQIAKAVMDGKVQMPSDPYRRAIYVAAVDRAEQKQEQKQNAAGAAVQPAGNVRPADVTQKQTPRKEARSAVDDLIPLAPGDRMQHILALPVAEQHDLLPGLPYPKRQALLDGLSPEQRETVVALNHPEAVIDGELQSAKLLRAVDSDRQLEKVLTDFWFNHFNVFIGKGADRYLVTAYERDVIRPHVLGKFRDLLIATAQSPAMLFYLDNWQSEGPNSDAATGRSAALSAKQPYGTRVNAPNRQKRRSGLNENYARELMELHTLGVNGGYTQQDVTEVARLFTGWTLDQPQRGGGYVFRPRLHEPGNKVVLGHTIKQGGENEGIEVLTLLSRQSATARFISTELAQRFVSDDPPKSLIDAMSKTYLKTDGDLREVMRTMFRSAEFWAPEAYRSRVKTPFEFVASSLRATEAEVVDPLPLLQVLNKMGQPLYGSQPPTGYSTKSDVWVNSAALLDRMNFGLALSGNKIPGTSFNLAQLMNSASVVKDGAPTIDNSTGFGDSSDPYQVELKLEQMLLAGDISRQTHDVIEQQIVTPQLAAAGQSAQNGPNVNVIAGLLIGSPEFQRK